MRRDAAVNNIKNTQQKLTKTQHQKLLKHADAELSQTPVFSIFFTVECQLYHTLWVCDIGNRRQGSAVEAWLPCRGKFTRIPILILYTLYKMSSAIRVKASAKSLPLPEAVFLIKYDLNHAVPFYYDKRTSALDVRFVNGFTSSTTVSGLNGLWVRANLENGNFLVTKVGSNFKTWYETAYGADSGSVSVYEPGVITKANVIAAYDDPDNEGAFSEERSTPLSYESAEGDASDDWLATVLFKKALVITYTKTVASVKTRYYRGFKTIWSEGRD